MANDNQNTVLDEQTDVVDEKSTKRVRKTKPKATDGGSTASLFGIEPYQPKKNEEYIMARPLNFSSEPNTPQNYLLQRWPCLIDHWRILSIKFLLTIKLIIVSILNLNYH